MKVEADEQFQLRKEMELNKPQTQYKASPLITGQSAIYLTPDYKRLHRARSPMHSEELPPYYVTPHDLVHPQSDAVPPLANGFTQQTMVPFGHYQQQTFQPMVNVEYPAMHYPEQYGYGYPHMDTVHDPQYDVPCGQQGN